MTASGKRRRAEFHLRFELLLTICPRPIGKTMRASRDTPWSGIGGGQNIAEVH